MSTRHSPRLSGRTGPIMIQWAMSQKHSEQVLCVIRSAIAEHIDLSQECFYIDEPAAFAAMERGGAAFVLRGEAEHNSSYKQIIPYCVLQDMEGRLLCYPRQGTEQRLHGFYSIGIGGHINPVDAVYKDHQVDVRQTVLRALLREVEEEAGLPEPVVLPRFRGLIHEEQSPVGMVHLGIVYTIQVPQGLVRAGEELAGSFWLSLDALMAKLAVESASLETWSLLALGLIGG